MGRRGRFDRRKNSRTTGSVLQQQLLLQQMSWKKSMLVCVNCCVRRRIWVPLYYVVDMLHPCQRTHCWGGRKAETHSVISPLGLTGLKVNHLLCSTWRVYIFQPCGRHFPMTGDIVASLLIMKPGYRFEKWMLSHAARMNVVLQLIVRRTNRILPLFNLSFAW